MAKKIKPPERRRIWVWADWDWMGGPAPMGFLYVGQSRGKEIFSFEYLEAWRSSAVARVLDPSLQLADGIQFADPDRGSFGLFLDSSPDRWGRMLMQRRENLRARIERRAPKTLGESEFLLGVHDLNRIGGLRFKLDEEGPFLDDDAQQAAPPFASLRELERASLHLEQEGIETDPQYAKWLRQLIAPGSSLGGARPKASLADSDGNLWIAKFPSRQDRLNIGGWELVVHRLARRAGIDVAPAQAKSFSSPFSTFLVRRFDRTDGQRRIHFSSAMNLLQGNDGDDFTRGASYLELAELIMRGGAQGFIEQDLEQLWRRVVFFISVSNTDDHLRNHGFLLTADGWRLSPAYDMNANPLGDGLKLNISETDNAQDLDLARSVAGEFRVAASRREEIIGEVLAAVRSWRDEAASLRLGREEIEQMENAFHLSS